MAKKLKKHEPLLKDRKEILSIICKVMGIHVNSIKISLLTKDELTFEATEMYEAPPITFAMLKEFSETFGTDFIDVRKGSTNSSGCETCDYGSSYGHQIIIKDATKNLIK